MAEKREGVRSLEEINRALDKLARQTELDRERAREDRERARDERKRADEDWRMLKRELAAISKEADQRSAEADKRMDKLDKLFTGEWGKLVECLVKGKAVELFRDWGVEITGHAKDRSGTRNGEMFEFDIILMNGEDVVVVEVKSTLDSEKADHFLGKMGRFTEFMPEYAGRRIFGAVAFLKVNEGMEVACQRKGLFVIKAVGDGAVLLNKAKGKFTPKEF